MQNRKILLFIALVFVSCMPVSAKVKLVAQDSVQSRIMMQYEQRLNALIYKYRVERSNASFYTMPVNPYYYKVLAPSLVYRSAFKQYFGIQWTPQSESAQSIFPKIHLKNDSILLLNQKINELLFTSYYQMPQLISSTEDEVHKMGVLREDITEELDHTALLIEQTEAPGLDADIGDTVALVVKKPNFWKYYTNMSLQAYQYYNTENWYKDKVDNYYNLMTSIQAGFSYNNKSKFNWETNFEMRLGFRPYPKDTEHKFKTSEDLLRLNSKLGYRATDHWNYTVSTEGTTQLLRSFYDNSNDVRSDFMSPFSSYISVGMEYKKSWSKFSFTAYLSPVAYNFKSVARKNLATVHGIKEHKSTYNKFGPFVRVDYNWNVWDNITWGGRIYWFSDLKMTTVEWENTINLKINKYIETQLFLYPRFDDSSPSYRSKKNGNFFMFKQWLSLKLNYNI